MDFSSLLDTKRVFSNKTSSCQKCALYEKTFVQSFINPESPIVFVSDFPNKVDASNGSLFSGDYGRLFKSILLDAGFTYDVSFLSCVKCTPLDEDPPKTSIKKLCCESFLFQEIKAIAPKLIVLVGSFALECFFPDKKIMDCKGNFLSKDGQTYLPVIHPAYCFHNPQYTSYLRQDITKARMYLSGDLYSGRDFKLISSIEEAEEAKKVLLASPSLGVDIETNSTLNCFEENAAIWTIAFSYAKDKAYCFAIDHPEMINVALKCKCVAIVKEILKSPIEKCFHNATFDIRWLRKFGYIVDTTNLFDTMVAAHILDNQRQSIGLKALASEYLDGCLEQFSDSLKALASYNSEDSSNTLRLRDIFYPQLQKRPKLFNLFQKVLMPVIVTIIDLELTGMKLDTEYLKEATLLFSQKKDAILDVIALKYPEAKDVDINSPKQLSNLFFNKMGLEPIRETKTGYSVDANVLTKLSENGVGIAKYLLKYRECEKILNTYLLKMPSMMQVDGRVHASFNLTGTVTGRLACVASWTPIVTKDGIKEIKDVCIGDYVWTHKERWKRVSATQIKGYELMYAVHFSNGEILTCTSSHKLLSSSYQWITIKELLDEHFKIVDQQEFSTCGRSLQTKRLANDDSNVSGVQNQALQHYLYFKKGNVSRRVPSTKGNSIFSLKNGVKKSNEREIFGTTSKMERLVRRWARLFNYNAQWHQKMRTSCCFFREARDTGTSRKYVCTSYRWGQEKQSNRQFGFSNKKWSQTDTLFTGKGQPSCSIEKINPTGCHAVYDITVEDDHSYLACGVFSHNSSKPNMQNLPRDKSVRKMFSVEKGNILCQFDASQAELRVSASIANEPTMIDAYQKGMDIHRLTASTVLGIPMDKVTKEDRQKAKGTNFGLLYGQKAEGFVMYAESNYGVKFSLKEAERIREEFFKTYARLLAWYKEVEANVRKHGAIEYPTGYVAYFANVKGAREIPDRIMNQAINFPVQGSSSHIIFYTMVMLRKFIQKYKMDIKFVSQVHDSIGLEMKEEDFPTLKDFVNTICVDFIPNQFPWLKCPMVFDFALGKSWGELTEVK